jgi:hypothetical protein
VTVRTSNKSTQWDVRIKEQGEEREVLRMNQTGTEIRSGRRTSETVSLALNMLSLRA